jgi:hypothetical protein
LLFNHHLRRNHMVKRTLLALTAVFFIFGTTGMALAAHPDNGPGCGLGKLAWGAYPGQQSIGAQVLQSTTNGIIPSQTFGISSGTSGCTNDGTIFASEKVNVFAAVNFDNLAQEMAQGQGEHLTSLATLMGIPAEQHGVFFSMAQEKYTTLIQAGETSPKAVVKAIYGAMGSHPVLAQASSTK